MSDSMKDFDGAIAQSRATGANHPLFVYTPGTTPASQAPSQERAPLRNEQPSTTIGPPISLAPISAISTNSPKQPLKKK